MVDFVEVVARIPEAPQDEEIGSSTSLLGVAAIVSLVVLMTGCGAGLQVTGQTIMNQRLSFDCAVKEGGQVFVGYSSSPQGKGRKVASSCPARGKCLAVYESGPVKEGPLTCNVKALMVPLKQVHWSLWIKIFGGNCVIKSVKPSAG